MADTKESGKQIEVQRGESAAQNFYHMADKVKTDENTKPYEMFSDVGRETAQGNYSKAQGILEGGTQWDDTLRGAASEIHRLDQERIGTKSISFEQAIDTISGYSARLEELNTNEDMKSALEIQKIASGTIKSGEAGI